MGRRSPRYWTAAITRFSEERRAAHHCERQGFRWYLPEIEERSPRGWRRVLMFPGYILVELSAEWRYLNSTKGIARVLSFGETPARIRAEFVETLRSRENSRGLVELHPRFSPGESAITYNGFRGVVREMLANDRCKLLMSIMGRSVEGEFDARELARVV